MMGEPETLERRVDSVGVVGPGRMGAQIALEYALSGSRVSTMSRHPERALAAVETAAQLASKFRLAPGDRIESALDRVTHGEDLVDRPDLIVESLPEVMQLKVDVLSTLAARFGDAVIVSNTSSLDVTLIGRRISAPQRTFVTHYLNPPLLMPIVEVVPGADTDESHVTWVVAVLRGLGREPVLVRTPAPGFIWNRLQFALLREAVALVRSGVATVEDIDAVMEQGLARRWRAIGPFATATLGGVSTFVRVAEMILPTLADDATLESLVDIVPEVSDDRVTHRDALLAADLGDRTRQDEPGEMFDGKHD